MISWRPFGAFALILTSFFVQSAIAFSPPFLTLEEYRKLSKPQKMAYVYALHLSQVRLEEMNGSSPKEASAGQWLRLILDAAHAADFDETTVRPVGAGRMCVRAGQVIMTTSQTCPPPRRRAGDRCPDGQMECEFFYQNPDVPAQSREGVNCVSMSATNSTQICANQAAPHVAAISASLARNQTMAASYNRYVEAVREYCNDRNATTQESCLRMAAPIAQAVRVAPAGAAPANVPAPSATVGAGTPAPAGPTAAAPRSGQQAAAAPGPANRPPAQPPAAAAPAAPPADGQGAARGVTVPGATGTPSPASTTPAPVTPAPASAAPPSPQNGFCSIAGHIVEARGGECPITGAVRGSCPQGQVSCLSIYLPQGVSRVCVPNDGNSTQECWNRLNEAQRTAIIERSRTFGSTSGRGAFNRLREQATSFCRGKAGAELEACLELASPLVAERARRDRPAPAGAAAQPPGAGGSAVTPASPPGAAAASPTTTAPTVDPAQPEAAARPQAGQPAQQQARPPAAAQRPGGAQPPAQVPRPAATAPRNPVIARPVARPAGQPAPAAQPMPASTDGEAFRPHSGRNVCDASARIDLLDDVSLPADARSNSPVCQSVRDRDASDRWAGGILRLDEVQDLTCGIFNSLESADKQRIEAAVQRGISDLRNRIACVSSAPNSGARQFYKTHLEAILRSLEACQRNKPTERPRFERPSTRIGQNRETGSLRLINPDHPNPIYRDVTIHPQDLGRGLGAIRNHRDSAGATARSIDPCNIADGSVQRATGAPRGSGTRR